MLKSWIPNSLSLANLSFGVLSILMGASLPFYEDPGSLLFLCGTLIIIAVFFDGFDGVVARWLKVESKLGEHLDTLADMVTFGIAPSFLIYQIHFKLIRLNTDFLPMSLPIGILITTIYPLCVAYRLARFSVNKDKRFFIGLPSPISAAIVVLLMILLRPSLGMGVNIAIFLTLSLLMVSNIHYPKPQATVQEHLSLIRLSIVALLMISSIIFLGWKLAGLFILILYTFSGLLSFAFHSIQKFKSNLLD